MSAQEYGRWHRDRAKAQLERTKRVLECGATVIEILCLSCGRKHEVSGGCRVGLLCLSCRGTIAARKRVRFLAARADVLEDATKRGLVGPHSRRRWSEKLLTLTAPHVLGDRIGERIERIAQAWVGFLRRLNRHWRSNKAKSAQFFRCLEWTPGNDGAGHPHIHVWLFCPYLDRGELGVWWRQALVEAGLPADLQVNAPDIREIRNGPRSAQEIIKYLTKDIDAQGRSIAPELYAEVYKAFDGRRVTQASKKFMARGEKQARCECGSDSPRQVRRRSADAEPSRSESHED